MNPENERTLQNLGVIGAINMNDKVNTKDDAFTIYVPTTLRGITRYFYGESRIDNIKRMQSCIRDAKQYISSSLSEINTNNEVESLLKKINTSTHTRQCGRMMDALEESQKGLLSLKITYKDDATSSTQLDILINDINDFLMTARQVAKSSPILERFN